MLNKLTFIYILMLCAVGFIAEIGYIYYKKHNVNFAAPELEKAPSRLQQFKQRFDDSKFSKAYLKYLNNQISLTFYDKEIPSVIFHRQQVLSLFGIVVFLGSFFIFPPLISIALLIGFALAVFYPNLNFYMINQGKAQYFDKILPVFISKVLLTLNVGMNLENALAYGVNSVDDPIVKKELEKLMVDIRLHPDSISEAFMNLKNRIIGSKECEKFASIVVSGLKNGNSMKNILEQEGERISNKQLKEVREEQSKRANIATALTVGAIFVPALLLLMIPLMQTGGLG